MGKYAKEETLAHILSLLKERREFGHSKATFKALNSSH
mgnify:CR=1 FL=1